MASAVNNLRINNKEVKKIFFNDKILKEFYFNVALVWKNANPFIFIKDLKSIDLTTLGSDTIIFENFGNEFTGSYNLAENLETDKPKDIGQMVVINTTEGDE